MIPRCIHIIEQQTFDLYIEVGVAVGYHWKEQKQQNRVGVVEGYQDSLLSTVSSSVSVDTLYDRIQDKLGLLEVYIGLFSDR